MLLRCVDRADRPSPESLNVMLIHNAPWVFQGIWKLLAPMLDPVVRAKIVRRLDTLQRS